MTFKSCLVQGVLVTAVMLAAGCHSCPPCMDSQPLPYACPLSEEDLWTYEEAPDASGQPVLDVYSSLELEIFDLVNEVRTERGLCPLAVDPCLFNVARLHSLDMAENNYFSHINAAGENVWNRLNREGIPYSRCAENIGKYSGAQNVASRIVEAWMKSDDHRTHILDCRYTHTGIGVSHNDSGYYFTQNFAAY